MKKRFIVLSLAALAGLGFAIQVYAGCGTCGPSEQHKKSCKAECTKPCCKAATNNNASKPSSAPCEKSGPACVKTSSGDACVKTGDAKAVKACGKACKQAADAAPSDVAEINTSGLKALLDAGISVHVLDARSAKYDDGRRIPGAISVPAGTNEKQVRKAIKDKNDLVVTYCGGLTCPASSKLADQLKALGYKNVVEYRYGIKGWADAGFPVTKIE